MTLKWLFYNKLHATFSL